MKLHEIKPNKYAPTSYVVKRDTEITEVIVVENKTTEKLLKLMFASENKVAHVGIPIWMTYEYADAFEVLITQKIDIPGSEVPIFS